MLVVAKLEEARIRSGMQTEVLQHGDTRRWAIDGEPHPVQRGAYGPVVFRVQITSVRQVRLCELDAEDARRLGFSSLASFKADFRRRHGGWEPNQQVWAIQIYYTGLPDQHRHDNLFDLLAAAKGEP